MSSTRREILEHLGIATASTMLWAFGCGGPAATVRRAPGQVSDDVRTWLRDAVARLAGTFPSVHALAVSRRRTTAAIDVLGAGVAGARQDGVVLTVRDRAGAWREQVTADLSGAGISTAVRALGATGRSARVDFPAPPAPSDEPPAIDELTLRDRAAILLRDQKLEGSRIVYTAGLIDIDDVTLWSIAPGHDLEHHVRRVRKRATRAAWNGSRPIISEVERGWAGELGDHELDDATLFATSKQALALMTPGAFSDGEHPVVIEPGIVAAIVDAAARGLLTTTAAQRPEVARRIALGAVVAPAAVTLIDDPTAPGAYGGFAFDDEGAPAAPITLLEQGRVVGLLADRAAVAAQRSAVAGRGRRAGHVGPLAPMPSHLRLAPGALTTPQLFDDGWLLEGHVHAVLDPGSDRIVVGVARARELRGGSPTGRVFADLELVGELAALLGAITGVGSETGTRVIRDERAGEPRWRSISAPWLRTRGVLRSRRRPA